MKPAIRYAALPLVTIALAGCTGEILLADNFFSWPARYPASGPIPGDPGAGSYDFTRAGHQVAVSVGNLWFGSDACPTPDRRCVVDFTAKPFPDGQTAVPFELKLAFSDLFIERGQALEITVYSDHFRPLFVVSLERAADGSARTVVRDRDGAQPAVRWPNPADGLDMFVDSQGGQFIVNGVGSNRVYSVMNRIGRQIGLSLRYTNGSERASMVKMYEMQLTI